MIMLAIWLCFPCNFMLCMFYFSVWRQWGWELAVGGTGAGGWQCHLDYHSQIQVTGQLHADISTPPLLPSSLPPTMHCCEGLAPQTSQHASTWGPVWCGNAPNWAPQWPSKWMSARSNGSFVTMWQLGPGGWWVKCFCLCFLFMNFSFFSSNYWHLILIKHAVWGCTQGSGITLL